MGKLKAAMDIIRYQGWLEFCLKIIWRINVKLNKKVIILTRLEERLKRLEKRNYAKSFKTFIYMGDLMQKRGEKISAHQLVIASRVIDIEQYRNGNLSFTCECTLEKMNNHDNMQPIIDRCVSNIQEFDKYGLNPSLSQIMVTTKGGQYFLPGNGTHRMGWLYCKGYPCVPVEITKRVAGMPEDGMSFLRSRGIAENFIELLCDKFEEIQSNLEQGLFCYLAEIDEITDVKEIIKKYGRLVEYDFKYANHNVWCHRPLSSTKRRLKKIASKRIKCFYFYPNEQDLYFEKFSRQIKSRYIEKIEREINILFKKKLSTLNIFWGGICHSVTESMLVRPYVEYNIYETPK